MIFRPAGIKGYPSYYEWLVGERLRPAVRVASLFVVGLNSFFLLLDAWVYPERLVLFAVLRLSWIATMLGVFFSIRIFDPLWCTRIACVVTGFFLKSRWKISDPICPSSLAHHGPNRSNVPSLQIMHL